MAVLACSVPKLDCQSIFLPVLFSIFNKTLFHSHFDTGALFSAGSIHIDAKKCHFSYSCLYLSRCFTLQ